MYLKLAWRNIWRNKRRSIITIASIFYAVMLAVFIRSIQDGTMDQMVRNIVGQYTGYIQVHQKGYWNDQALDNAMLENDTLLKDMKSYKSIKQVVPRVESFMLSSSGNTTKGAMVVGIDPGAENALMNISPKIIAGQYFISSEEPAVIIASGLADFLKLKINDTLVLIGQGYHGQSAAGKYPVKAIVKIASPDLNKMLIFMPVKEAQDLLSMPGLITGYALVLNDTRDIAKTRGYLVNKIDKNRFEALDWKEMLPEIDQMIEGHQGGTYIFLIVLYMIIAFGILGTVLMMTKERSYEFGVLVSIGMSRFSLAMVTALESIIISLLGTLIGFLASIPLILYFVKYPIHVTGRLAQTYQQYGMAPFLSTLFDPAIFYHQAIIIFGMAIIICMYPVSSILKLKPVEAMHND